MRNECLSYRVPSSPFVSYWCVVLMLLMLVNGVAADSGVDLDGVNCGTAAVVSTTAVWLVNVAGLAAHEVSMRLHLRRQPGHTPKPGIVVCTETHRSRILVGLGRRIFGDSFRGVASSPAVADAWGGVLVAYDADVWDVVRSHVWAPGRVLQVELRERVAGARRVCVVATYAPATSHKNYATLAPVVKEAVRAALEEVCANEEHDHVLVAGDWNEELEPTSDSYASLCAEHELQDAARWHDEMKATCVRRIDGIFVDRQLVEVSGLEVKRVPGFDHAFLKFVIPATPLPEQQPRPPKPGISFLLPSERLAFNKHVVQQLIQDALVLPDATTWKLAAARSWDEFCQLGMEWVPEFLPEVKLEQIVDALGDAWRSSDSTLSFSPEKRAVVELNREFNLRVGEKPAEKPGDPTALVNQLSAMVDKVGEMAQTVDEVQGCLDDRLGRWERLMALYADKLRCNVWAPRWALRLRRELWRERRRFWQQCNACRHLLSVMKRWMHPTGIFKRVMLTMDAAGNPLTGSVASEARKWFSERWGSSTTFMPKEGGVQAAQAGSHQLQHSLDQAILPGELQEAAKRMKRDSAPGPDGVGVGAWCELHDVFWPALAKFCQEAWSEQRNCQGRFVLLPKASSSGALHQFRPLTVLNISTRLIHSVFAQRLVSVLKADPDSTPASVCGFVPGRSIHRILSFARVMADAAGWCGFAPRIVSLDVQRAYDSVNLEFLDAALIRKGVSSVWRHRYLSFLRGLQMTLTVDHGAEREHISLGPWMRGIPQGDPLAPWLWVFVTELLEEEHRSAMMETAREVGWDEYAVDDVIPTWYADDLTLFQRDPSNSMLILHLRKWAAVLRWAQLGVAWKKSWLAGAQNGEAWEELVGMMAEEFPEVQCGQGPFRLLGVHFHWQDTSDRILKLVRSVCGSFIQAVRAEVFQAQPWQARYLLDAVLMPRLQWVLTYMPLSSKGWSSVDESVRKAYCSIIGTRRIPEEFVFAGSGGFKMTRHLLMARDVDGGGNDEEAEDEDRAKMQGAANIMGRGVRRPSAFIIGHQMAMLSYAVNDGSNPLAKQWVRRAVAAFSEYVALHPLSRAARRGSCGWTASVLLMAAEAGLDFAKQRHAIDRRKVVPQWPRPVQEHGCKFVATIAWKQNDEAVLYLGMRMAEGILQWWPAVEDSTCRQPAGTVACVRERAERTVYRPDKQDEWVVAGEALIPAQVKVLEWDGKSPVVVSLDCSLIEQMCWVWQSMNVSRDRLPLSLHDLVLVLWRHVSLWYATTCPILVPEERMFEQWARWLRAPRGVRREDLWLLPHPASGTELSCQSRKAAWTGARLQQELELLGTLAKESGDERPMWAVMAPAEARRRDLPPNAHVLYTDGSEFGPDQGRNAAWAVVAKDGTVYGEREFHSDPDIHDQEMKALIFAVALSLRLSLTGDRVVIVTDHLSAQEGERGEQTDYRTWVRCGGLLAACWSELVREFVDGGGVIVWVRSHHAVGECVGNTLADTAAKNLAKQKWRSYRSIDWSMVVPLLSQAWGWYARADAGLVWDIQRRIRMQAARCTDAGMTSIVCRFRVDPARTHGAEELLPMLRSRLTPRSVKLLNGLRVMSSNPYDHGGFAVECRRCPWEGCGELLRQGELWPHAFAHVHTEVVARVWTMWGWSVLGPPGRWRLYEGNGGGVSLDIKIGGLETSAKVPLSTAMWITHYETLFPGRAARVPQFGAQVRQIGTRMCWASAPALLKWIQHQYGDTVEGFADVWNHCSKPGRWAAAEEWAKGFGSRGSFFDQPFDSVQECYYVNTPYEREIVLRVLRLGNRLRIRNWPSAIVAIIPTTDRLSSEGVTRGEILATRPEFVYHIPGGCMSFVNPKYGPGQAPNPYGKVLRTPLTFVQWGRWARRSGPEQLATSFKSQVIQAMPPANPTLEQITAFITDEASRAEAPEARRVLRTWLPAIFGRSEEAMAPRQWAFLAWIWSGLGRQLQRAWIEAVVAWLDEVEAVDRTLRSRICRMTGRCPRTVEPLWHRRGMRSERAVAERLPPPVRWLQQPVHRSEEAPDVCIDLGKDSSTMQKVWEGEGRATAGQGGARIWNRGQVQTSLQSWFTRGKRARETTV